MEKNSLLLNEANVLLDLLARRYNYKEKTYGIADLSEFKDKVLNISWNDENRDYAGELIYVFVDEGIVINLDNRIFLHVDERFAALKDYFERINKVSA
ncbi:hypothetical protein C5745_18180 [Sphingobacterium haloxyli]|uniref:Uncharacterized protein n=2 Tax=Sphingobacterium haloxyli TaxID=2100533 RepID=A0A2S9IYB5_9SPHI|nr:hypothetical protein C5745_18180 [Sphingobacterium haloxyli]